jgi:hypothetical protein
MRGEEGVLRTSSILLPGSAQIAPPESVDWIPCCKSDPALFENREKEQFGVNDDFQVTSAT